MRPGPRGDGKVLPLRGLLDRGGLSFLAGRGAGRAGITVAAGKAYARNGLLEILESLRNLNLHPDVVKRDQGLVVRRYADGVLFRSHHDVRTGILGLQKKAIELFLLIPVVIEKPSPEAQFARHPHDELLEAARGSNPAKDPDVGFMKQVEGLDLVAVDLLEELGLVDATDDLGVAVVLPNGLKKLQFWLDLGLGQENVGRPREMPDGFAQDSTGQKAAVAEGVGLVDQSRLRVPLIGRY